VFQPYSSDELLFRLYRAAPGAQKETAEGLPRGGIELERAGY
jgi:hypothetical protein